MIFLHRLWIPRFRMKPQPNRAFSFPLIAQIFGNSISETKGDEIYSAFLLPMRQSILRMLDFRLRVEELKFVHGENSIADETKPRSGGFQAADLK